MKVTMIIVLGLLFSANVVSAKEDSVKQVPLREFDEDGNKLAPQDIMLIHDKDCSNDGWKFNLFEWESIYFFPIEPVYYNDPINGSNGGYSIA